MKNSSMILSPAEEEQILRKYSRDVEILSRKLAAKGEPYPAHHFHQIQDKIADLRSLGFPKSSSNRPNNKK